MIDDCTLIVLAGGDSRRMGEEKVFLELAGKPLIHHLVEKVQPCFETMFISLHTPQPDIPFAQLPDVEPDRGPIIGIATALQQVETSWVFVVAGDMPFASVAMIEAMAEQRENYAVVVPKVKGVFQPLFAFYSKAALPIVQAAIAQQQRSLKVVMGKLARYVYSEDECRRYDPELLSFFDLDTPQDRERAEAMVGAVALTRSEHDRTKQG